MLIEQAIFTSAQTDRAQGYQLLSRSPGLTEADARELSVWGPSHNSLLDEASAGASTNFFRLASGSYCVSRTTIAGNEYSGRGGESVYTQFLIVPPETMAKFANNPFAVLRAAMASGVICVHEIVPEELEPVRLSGRAPVVDLTLMAQLARDPGPAAVATMIQAALASERLAIFADTPSELLIAGLINTLPVECRTEFSFTTGLKFSPSRPVRVSTLPADQAAWRAIDRRGVTLLRLDGLSASNNVDWQGWAAWVAAILSSGKLSVLAAELEKPRPGFTLADLGALGEQLQDNLQGTTCAVDEDLRSPDELLDLMKKAQRAANERSAHLWPATGNETQRADQPHRSQPAGLVAESPLEAQELDDLATQLAQQPREVLELLERIDDLVFSAISGDERALAELEVLWPLATVDLDEELVKHSREQYLRCALSICSDVVEDGTARPERAMSAVEVLCVLFDE